MRSFLRRDCIGNAGRASRARAASEIVLAYGLILLVVWTPRPWQQGLWWVAAAVVVLLTALSWPGLEAMGLRRANLLRSLWVAAAALALAGAGLCAAARVHTLRLPANPLLLASGYGAYAVWAAVQQFLLQCFFLARLLRLLPRAWMAAGAAAGLFALAHLPNPLLTVATALWGAASCALFLRYRNLYPLALAHAILGVALAITLPGSGTLNLRVGLGYLQHRHTHRAGPQRSQSDQRASTVAWVTAEAPTLRRTRQARP